MVAFAGGSVVVYETPDKKRWVAFEDYDRLRRLVRLSDHDAKVLEWAIQMFSDTADALEGEWDGEETERDCRNVRRAVEIMRNILERLS